MIAIAHFIAISCYIGAAALAATPFVRPVAAPLRGVIAVLGAGVAAHGAALASVGRAAHQLPLTGLGPALSFAGFVLALTLVIAELLARDVSLTLVAAPFAALATAIANIIGLRPLLDARGLEGVWLVSHIALSFAGMAAFATAAAAGAMYLLERRELKSRRFGAIFRFFPPLETLDRVNHHAAIAGWLSLTLGVVLAATYSLAHQPAGGGKLVWAIAAWLVVSALAGGRLVGGWRARRAALLSSVGFAAVVALYVAMRVAGSHAGMFL